MKHRRTFVACLAVLLTAVGASSRPQTPAQAPVGTKPAAPSQAATGARPAPKAEARPGADKQAGTAPLSGERDKGALVARFTGDFDGMRQRRVVRVLVTYSKTNYFVDFGTQRGLTYEAFKLFDDHINDKYKTGLMRTHVAFVPVSREDLIPALLDGRGDVAAASLTVTPERQKLVDFSAPTQENVSEIVVTGPASEPVATVDDLSGREVFVRKSSSYHASLEALNGQLAAQKKPPVTLRLAPENLEDEDLLEMLNAGLVKYVIVDDYLAAFWATVLPAIKPQPAVAVRKAGVLAWAIRPNSPLLKAELDEFLAKNPAGSATRNILLRRYLKNTKFVKNAASEAERKKFWSTIDIFRKYAAKYDMDYLLMAAQGYQESRLSQSAKSQVGAVGVMQVMPATGKDMKVGDIAQVDPNIHAGVKYMRFMVDQYFAKEPMDAVNKHLFAFASYNAGPGRVRQLRRQAEARGLDPNVWFNNVEVVAAEKIGRETVTYVSNIYKYYVAYKLVVAELEEKQRAKEGVS